MLRGEASGMKESRCERTAHAESSPLRAVHLSRHKWPTLKAGPWPSDVCQLRQCRQLKNSRQVSESIISSMTKKERADPALLLTSTAKTSRLKRLANVSFCVIKLSKLASPFFCRARRVLATSILRGGYGQVPLRVV